MRSHVAGVIENLMQQTLDAVHVFDGQLTEILDEYGSVDTTGTMVTGPIFLLHDNDTRRV